MLRAWDASFFVAVTPGVAVEVGGGEFDSRKLNRLPLSKTEKYCEALASGLLTRQAVDLGRALKLQEFSFSGTLLALECRQRLEALFWLSNVGNGL